MGFFREINGHPVYFSGADPDAAETARFHEDRDPFKNDPKRAAARTFAADVNQRVIQGDTEARAAARQYTSDANKEYGRLQSHRPAPPGDDAPDQEHEARQAANEADAKSAVAHANSKLSPDHADAMSDSHAYHADILAEGGELGRDETEDFRNEVHDRDIKRSPDEAKQHVPDEHKAYIEAHADRIDEALQDTGRINADRVFSEADDGTKAIPAASARQAIQTANEHYAKAARDISEDNEEVDPDDARHEAAEKAVKQAAKGLKGSARQRVLDDIDKLVGELVEHGRIGHGFFA